MTRIQFWGDLAATGFGTVTADLGSALIAQGHDVRFVSQNEITDLPEPFASRTLHITRDMANPERLHALGLTSLSMLPEYIIGLIEGTAWKDGWRPDAAIILGDFVNVRLLVEADENTARAFASLPTLHYVPIEGVGLSPRWAEMWRIVHPVAMTEFGATEIAKITGTRPRVVYHGIDTTQFRPATVEKPLRVKGAVLRDKEACKKAMGVDPRARIVLRMDRNMPRKRYAALLRSMAPVIAARPDTYLVLHCLVEDEGGDLRDELAKYPPQIRTHVVMTDGGGGASRDELTVLYNAADIYATTSPEGFGLTIAEALACGTPVVGLDYSAVPEVIGPGGYVVPPAFLYDNEYSYYWASPDEAAFGQAVAYLLDHPVERRQLGRAGVEHVRTKFQWSIAATEMSAAIDDVLAEKEVAA